MGRPKMLLQCVVEARLTLALRNAAPVPCTRDHPLPGQRWATPEMAACDRLQPRADESIPPIALGGLIGSLIRHWAVVLMRILSEYTPFAIWKISPLGGGSQ